MSTTAFGDPAKQWLKTTVNGEERQSSSISDLLFDCEDILSFLSQGTTVEKGTVVMTGTPGGSLPLQFDEYLKKEGQLLTRFYRCWRPHEATTISCAGGCGGGVHFWHWYSQKRGQVCIDRGKEVNTPSLRIRF